jgi:LysM repeat protein
MESLNLIDLVRGHLTGDIGNKISSLLGESRDRTQAGIDMAIPEILTSFDNVASTTDGAHRLSSAIDNAGSGILSNLGSLFGGGFTSDTGMGSLRSLVGGERLTELSGSIGRSSGLNPRAVTTLLGLLAPIVLGVLKRLKDARELGALGLANLLAGQRTNIAAARSEAMRATYSAAEESRSARGTLREVRTEEPTAKRSSYALPLLLVAGLVGLLWYGASRSRVKAGLDDDGLARRTARVQETYKGGLPASFERLRTKYSPVLREAEAQGIHLSKLEERGGKLVIEGTAPSMEAANAVWDEIKRVNPRMNDVAANFPVSASQGFIPDTNVTRAKPSAPADTTATTGMQTYTVKRGDTLSSISQQFYGNPKDYMRIFDANRSRLKNHNIIQVGQELEIPGK